MRKLFLLWICWACLSLALQAQQIWYVRADAAAGGNGKSWAGAWNDLHSGLAAAFGGDQVWVATGVYKPDTAADRGRYFELRSGVSLYGGFEGWENSPQQRLTEARSVLSGDIGAQGDSTDNSYTILYMDQPDSLTLVSGFIFEGGQAWRLDNPKLHEVSGGAVFVHAGNGTALPVFERCVFRNNAAVQNGGAVSLTGQVPESCMPVFRHCEFVNNKGWLGGAVFWNGGAKYDQGTEFSDCKFINNYAFRGAGIYFMQSRPYSGSLDYKRCVMDGNRSESWSGFGIQDITHNQMVKWGMTMDSCHMARNYCKTGIYIYRFWTWPNYIALQDVRVTNCLIEDHVTEPGWHGASGHALFYFTDTYNSIDHVYIVDNNIVRNNIGDTTYHLFAFWGNQAATTNIYKNNTFTGNFFSTCFAYLPSAEEAIIEKNTLVKNTLYRISPRMALIQNNLFEANHFIHFNIWSVPYQHRYINNTYVDNTTVSNPDISPVLNGDTIYYINNLFLNNRDSETGQLMNNPGLFGANDRVIYYSHNLMDTLSAIGPGVFYDTTDLIGAAWFVAPDQGDYRLHPCSAGVDAGLNAAIANPTSDLAGRPRIANGRVDMGAYETEDLQSQAALDIKAACPGLHNGAVALRSPGACEPLSYLWLPDDDGMPKPYMEGLAPGEYSLTVTDARGQSLEATVQAPQAPEFSATLLAVPLWCGDTTGGSATLYIEGGEGPFAYLWSGGSSEGLAAGSYQVTVSDIHGCSATIPFQIGQQGSLNAEAVIQPIVCHGGSGQLSTAPLNGLPPYQYHWSNGATTPVLAQQGPGNYTVSVTDALGCQTIVQMSLNDPPPLLFEVAAQPSDQPSQPNGALSLTALKGGLPPYSIWWSTGDTSWQIANLPPGIYGLILTDALGCTASGVWDLRPQTSSATDWPGIPDLMLSPNPAATSVVLSGQMPRSSAWILLNDPQGRELARYPATSPEIPLNHLPSGWYRLSVTDTQGAVLWSGWGIKL